MTLTHGVSLPLTADDGIDPMKICSFCKGKIAMTAAMQGSIKRWTAKRMTAHLVEIIEGKTAVAEAV
jgi:hypothetical protein